MENRRLRKLNLESLRRQAKAAQKNEQYIPGCTGKRPYPTHAAAQEMIERRKEGGETSRLTTYRCRTCDKWHITSHRARDRARKESK